jgi:CRP-like cAMP-binding protein
VSANARPLRVAGYGDAVGLASMLLGGGSPDTTIALGTMRALAASQDQFRELLGRPAIRERLVAAAPARRRRRRAARAPNHVPETESSQAAELAGSVSRRSLTAASGALASTRRPHAGILTGRLRKLHATVKRSRW